MPATPPDRSGTRTRRSRHHLPPWFHEAEKRIRVVHLADDSAIPDPEVTPPGTLPATPEPSNTTREGT